MLTSILIDGIKFYLAPTGARGAFSPAWRVTASGSVVGTIQRLDIDVGTATQRGVVYRWGDIEGSRESVLLAMVGRDAAAPRLVRSRSGSVAHVLDPGDYDTRCGRDSGLMIAVTDDDTARPCKSCGDP
jgi:hypothetical protein